jgi:3-oxoadipate enol-lactonase
MTGERSGYVTTGDGCRIFYRIDGRAADGPTIVFSNSLGTAHALWDAQVALLARDVRIVRYDSRGHGRSDAPPGPYAIDRLADDVVDLLDALGITRTAFCGISLGGMIGQSLGARHAERFTQLVLANTAAEMGPPENWATRIATVRAGGMAALRDGVLERWFTPEFRRDAPAHVARIGAMFDASSVDGYAATCAAIAAMDQRERLAAITVPTLVIVGTRDPATPPAQGEFIAQRISGAQLIALETAHLSNVERPDEFTAALRERISRA